MSRQVTRLFDGCHFVSTVNRVDERGVLRGTESKTKTENGQLIVVTNHANTMRGMHCAPCAKLVCVAQGRVIDVLIDMRLESPTYGSFFVVWLDSSGDALQLCAGIAHGYCSPEPSTIAYTIESAYVKPRNSHRV